MLYGISEKIFELEKRAEESLRRYQVEKIRHLDIDASESFGAYFLPEIINRFNRVHPETHVTVDILPNSRVVENILNLKKDLGFISYPLEHPNLVIRELVEDELVVILHPDHPLARLRGLTPADLEGQVMIMHEEGSVFQEVINAFMTENGISLSMPITLSNNEAIKGAVEGGSGIAMMSRRVVKKEVQAGKLVAIPMIRPPMMRKFYIVYHKDKIISVSMARFIELAGRWAPRREGTAG